MNKKKIMWSIILIIFIISISLIIFFANSKKDNNNNSSNNIYNKSSNVINNNEAKNNVEYQKRELADGVLYSIEGKEYKSDIVIGDNYFDTTINDMFLNPASYMNKNIEIEGLYLENAPYKFVGRYSTSNLCQYCPVGYSYLEYQLKGTLDRNFEDQNDWIKIIGTLTKGNDVSSDFQDYYYLEVLSLEVMNEKGQDTVNN